MNIAIYSFKRIELREINQCVRKLGYIEYLSNVYIYSENTKKERMSERQAFKDLLDDYEEKNIELVILKDLESVGQSNYIRALIFRELINRKCKFCCIKENIHNLNVSGIFFATKIIEQALEEKRFEDRRNKKIQETKS